jgi:hypothetical protein
MAGLRCPENRRSSVREFELMEFEIDHPVLAK